MKPIGGFFELEAGGAAPPFHAGAMAFCSGRACLRRILEETRPRRALVPFYICDSALVPFDALGVPYTFYPLTASLEPDLPAHAADDASVLYVNYFDLKSACAQRLVSWGGGRVIVDDTQAFFRRGYSGGWSFNSARKFFGVPDGGYAYGSGLPSGPACPRLEDVRYDHLVNRLLGRQAIAYQQYVESEAAVSASPRRPSLLTERLLANIDYDGARAARRRNFALVHDRLGPLNRLSIAAEPLADAVPFCYPFMPDRPVLRDALWRRDVFVPQLWPEVIERGVDGFEWERDLARRLLPLPIDQRYGAGDMEHVCHEVAGILA